MTVLIVIVIVIDFGSSRQERIGGTEEKADVTMNAYGQVLSDAEIWSVVRYIRDATVKILK